MEGSWQTPTIAGYDIPGNSGYHRGLEANVGAQYATGAVPCDIGGGYLMAEVNTDHKYSDEYGL